MNLRKRAQELDLVAVLLFVAFLELALNRLAVPVLRPQGQGTPPMWHRELDRAGLFLLHLTSLLGLGVTGWKLWDLTIRRRQVALGAGIAILIGALPFLVLATWAILFDPPVTLRFHLESSFTLLLLLLGMAMATRDGDGLVKLGFLLITVPFLFHYYGTFALRMLMSSDAAKNSSLPDRMRDFGQWSVALAAIGVAVCFAPRPILRSFSRPAPLMIAGFVGVLVAVILYRHEDVGRELASRGLGIDYMPGAPVPMLTAFVLGAAAVAWTLTVTLTDPDPARRMLGSGYALVIVGGYAFAWPAQLLTVAVGALAITDAALQPTSVAVTVPVQPRMPLITGPVWQTYVRDVAAALGAAWTTENTGTSILERLAGERKARPYELVLARSPAGVEFVEITFGSAPLVSALPVWSLAARAEHRFGKAAHPAPPEIPTAMSVRTGDEPFDERFRLRDSGGVTAKLFDEGLRARAAAVLDGWMALWPGGIVRYRVCPGRGAPLDHPVPILALAAGQAQEPDRLVNVLDLVAELAVRASNVP